jgi:pyruvate carboxylase
MDVFRVFDSLNYIENMRIGMDAVGTAGGVIEAAISYTGDVSNPNETKYTLDYYLGLTRQLVDSGAHVLAIKDMAGLLKPAAAKLLVGAIRAEFPDLPIHVHCHDTSGNGVASMLEAARAGADAVDAAMDSMSGMTSQPSMGALAASLESEGIKTGVVADEITTLSEYWETRRGEYAPFECTVTMKSGTADVYKHHIPGGQYTNLHFQAFSMGQAEQWPAIKKAYAQANEACGDIVKVTPSSKVVGDLALFMVQNGLDKDSLLEQADSLNFPTSVIEFFQGYLGQPLGGFPPELQAKVLRLGTDSAMEVVTGRPGATMEPFDFGAEQARLEKKWGPGAISWPDVLSSSLYPAVFEEYMTFKKQYGDVSSVPTRCFFAPMDIGEEVSVPMGDRTMHIRCNAATDADANGRRQLFFEVDGNPIAMYVTDKASMEGVITRDKASEEPGSVGAPMPGKVVGIRVEAGMVVAKGTPLVVLSAMKMETIVKAPITGLIKTLTVTEGEDLAGGDLLVEIVPTESIRMP